MERVSWLSCKLRGKCTCDFLLGETCNRPHNRSEILVGRLSPPRPLFPFYFTLKFLIKVAMVAMVAMPREQTQTRGQCTRTQRRRCWEQGLRLAQHMAALERRICFTNNSNRDNDLLSRLTPPLMTQSQRASYCHLNKYSSLQRHPVCGSPLHSAQPISALVPAALPNGVLVHRSTRLATGPEGKFLTSMGDCA